MMHLAAFAIKRNEAMIAGPAEIGESVRFVV
jgi:hypothetical protein